MDITEDILSLTDFKRRSAELLAQLKTSQRPLVLTVNGRAEAVVQNAAAYMRMTRLLEELETVTGIRRGLADVEAGRVTPLEDVAGAFEREHGLGG